MDGKQKEVRFDIFCRSCSFYPTTEDQEPCTTCLSSPASEESHKPVKYRQSRAEIYYLMSNDPVQVKAGAYTYDLKKAVNWDQLPTDAELKQYFFVDKGNYYEKPVTN